MLKRYASVHYELQISTFFSRLKVFLIFRTKINLNEISHNSAMGLVRKAIDNGVLLTEVSYFVLEMVIHVRR